MASEERTVTVEVDAKAFVENELDPMAEAIADRLEDQFRRWGFEIKVEFNHDKVGG